MLSRRGSRTPPLRWHLIDVCHAPRRHHQDKTASGERRTLPALRPKRQVAVPRDRSTLYPIARNLYVGSFGDLKELYRGLAGTSQGGTLFCIYLGVYEVVKTFFTDAIYSPTKH